MSSFKKRGDVKEITLFIWRFFFLAFALGVFVWLISFFIINSLDVVGVQQSVVQNRIYYSPNAMNYVDPSTGRNYPGIIDLQRMTEENLQASLNYSIKQVLAVKVELYDEGKQQLIKQIYLDRSYYKKVEAEHRGFIKKKTVQLDSSVAVVTYDGSEFKNGVLVISIITEK
jgi:hypothetical protein